MRQVSSGCCRQKGKDAGLSGQECGFRKSVSILSNARCPECHKKMELKGEGESKSFFCTCGYREKLEAFNARKREHVTKKEVGKFLKQQDTGETINSALADALAKMEAIGRPSPMRRNQLRVR
jgi:DNA topoisomerase-3